MFHTQDEYLIFRHHINFSAISSLLPSINDKDFAGFLKRLDDERSSIFSSLEYRNEDYDLSYYNYLKVISLMRKNDLFFEEPFTYCYEKYPYNFVHFCLGSSTYYSNRGCQNIDVQALENAFDNCEKYTVEKLKLVREAIFKKGFSILETANLVGCSRQAIDNLLDRLQEKWRRLGKHFAGSYVDFAFSSNFDDVRKREADDLRDVLSFSMFNNGTFPIEIQNSLMSIAWTYNPYRTIEEMDFSVRTYNCLKRAGINTVWDIIEGARKESDPAEWFMKIRNLGKRGFDETIEKLSSLGIDISDLDKLNLNRTIEKINQITIEEMDFSVRTYNCLHRAGIHTVGDIIGLTWTELMKVRNLGKKSFDELREKLSSLGIDIDIDDDNEYSKVNYRNNRFSYFRNKELYDKLDNNQKTKIVFLMEYLNEVENIDVDSFFADNDNCSKLVELIINSKTFDYNSLKDDSVLSNKYLWSTFADDEHKDCLTDDEKNRLIEFVINKFFPDNFDLSQISSRLYSSLHRQGYPHLDSAVAHSTEVTDILNTSANLMTKIEFNDIINQNKALFGTRTYILSVSRGLLNFMYKNHIDSFHSLAMAFFDDFKHCAFAAESIKDSIKKEVQDIMCIYNVKKQDDSYDLNDCQLTDEAESSGDFDVEVVRCEKSTFSGGNSGQIVYITIRNNTRKNLTVSVDDVYLIQDNEQIKRTFWLSGYMMKKEKIPPKLLKTAAAIFYDNSLRNEDLRYSKIGVVLQLNDDAESKEFVFSYDFENNCWSKINYDNIV